MPYEMSVHAQDPSVGRVGIVLDALTNASEQAGEYEYVDIAVAYASDKGVRLLDEALSNGPWIAARKRFLVSIDFGFTQPQALVRLSQLDNAEVRVPNGRAVLTSSTLRPPSAFHAKTFVFRRGDGHPYVRALIIGSANLTASALSTGAEVVTKQVWSGESFSGESWNHRKSVEPVLDWFEDTWQSADPLSEVLDDYRSRHRSMPKPRIPPEERTPTTRRYLASPAKNVISGTLPVQLAAARTLWIHGTSITQNREPRPGNQLNTRKGTRVFFGFGAENVPADTRLGKVLIRVDGHPYVERSVRFSGNGMDIVGLPIPEQNGLESYQDQFLIFTREKSSASGEGQFTLTVTDEAGLAALKESAANSIDLTLNGGRQFGLLF